MNKLALTTLGTVALLAMPLSAQAVEFTFGTQANGAYSDDEFSTSGEAYAGAALGGAFAGFWIGSLPDDFEYELSLGYGMDIGEVALAATTTAYFTGDGGYGSQDIALEAAYGITDAVELGAGISYDFDSEMVDVSAGLGYDFADSWNAAALVGHDGTGIYWEAGVTYGFAESAWIGLLYEDSDYDPSTITLSVGYDFGPYGG